MDNSGNQIQAFLATVHHLNYFNLATNSSLISVMYLLKLFLCIL